MNKHSPFMNRLYFSLFISWTAFALLTLLLFLGITLSGKDNINRFITDGKSLIENSIVDFGFVKFTSNNGGLKLSNMEFTGFGITTIIFFAITLFSGVGLIGSTFMVKTNSVKNNYVIWTAVILLAVLIFNLIIGVLGSPLSVSEGQWFFDTKQTGNNSAPIIANMYKGIFDTAETTKLTGFSLDGGSISILLVDIVVIGILILTVSNVSVGFVKSYKNNFQELVNTNN